MSDEVQSFLSNLPKWQKFFDSFRLPPAITEAENISELKQRLSNVRRRLRDGPDAPLRIAFFGPTGAGKSKLFGSLIRDNFSGSGFKRPFTRRSFYYVHNEWKPLVAALEGEVSLHEDEVWRDTILVDTPDFDSVEAKNREEAERVFLECDGFLFVTDALKYADASTWEYLERIHAAGKAFAVILNKVRSETVSKSFRERFERTLGKGTESNYVEIIVPEFRIDDATLIDSDQECMKQLETAAKQLVTGDSRKQASIELLTQECESFCSYSDDLRIRVTSKRTHIDEAKRALQVRYDAAQRRLENRLSSGLEPVVREEVYQDVLCRLEEIDVLSYPRKLIAMPINGIRSLLGGWLPSKEQPPVQEDPAFADPVSSETFHLLESEMIAFADQSRNDIAARPGLEDLISRDTFKSLRYDHDEIQQLYTQHHEEFAQWVASHAEETASQITGENKVKFVLSQVLFNTVLISSQVATHGTMSILEIGATSVISPMVAKGISMAIGSEKVKEFEKAAHEQHQKALSELLIKAKERFDVFLDRSCIGLGELEENLNGISASRAYIDGVVAHFRGLDLSDEATVEGER